MALNLCLHAGGHRVEREQLASVVTPAPSGRWRPISHQSLLDRVQGGLVAAGWQIRSEAHALNHDGESYFGLMELGMPGEDGGDYSLVAGLRNDNAKRFPAGLAIGSQVFVCDNLAFSSEITLARKHTTNIERDLPRLIIEAVGKLHDHRKHQDGRIACYKQTEMNDQQAHDLIVKALDVNAIGCTAIPAVVAEWREPKHPEFAEKTAWRLFNAFTEVFKETGNLDRMLVKSQALHGLFDSACKLAV